MHKQLMLIKLSKVLNYGGLVKLHCSCLLAKGNDVTPSHRHTDIYTNRHTIAVTKYACSIMLGLCLPFLPWPHSAKNDVIILKLNV
jgi:hypothetical protein